MKELDQLTAEQLMRECVPVVDAEATIREAAQDMVKKGCQSLVVPMADDSLRSPGIITIKDIVQLLGEVASTALDELRVRDVMTQPVICVTTATSIVDCINLMRMTGVRRLLVTQDTQPVGMLSYGDVLQYVVE